MERLLRKFETAKTLLPQPVVRIAKQGARHAVLHYGSTAPAMDEATAIMEQEGIPLDTLRVRGYPFADAVREFIDAHDCVFVVEQNRDAQLRTLLVEQFGIDPAHLVPVLHYDGTPITARFITATIGEHLGRVAVRALREDQPSRAASPGLAGTVSIG
jgi:2-oxoglutarate ferredoxin oxidoreductase subunit alpha